MATMKTILNETNTTGWKMGFRNFMWKENRRWWKTRMWLIQTALWLILVSGSMVPILTIDPEYEFSWMCFFVMAGILPAFGVTIIMQDALVEEKQSGTAAWVLSKPISRIAYILSKWFANSLGFLITVVLIQGISIYFLMVGLTKWKVDAAGLVLGMGLVALFLLFCLTLTLTLGTFFNSRSPVIGISLLALLIQYLLLGFPILRPFIPAFLVLPAGQEPNTVLSLAASAAMSKPLPALLPVITTSVLIVIFLAVALWRFQKEEF
jgi:ABC-2 type transport system permease protein